MSSAGSSGSASTSAAVRSCLTDGSRQCLATWLRFTTDWTGTIPSSRCMREARRQIDEKAGRSDTSHTLSSPAMHGLMPWIADARNGYSRRRTETGTRCTRARLVRKLPEAAMPGVHVPSQSPFWSGTAGAPLDVRPAPRFRLSAPSWRRSRPAVGVAPLKGAAGDGRTRGLCAWWMV